MRRILVFLFKIMFFLFWLTACRKNDVSRLSSEKEISEMVFKSSDNPFLHADIKAIINSDTIKAGLPEGTSLNSLIPTISFSGKGISPDGGVAQNFTKPVTYTITAEDGSIKNYTLSCRIATLADTVSLISGKWNVVKDSITNVGDFYFLIGGTPNFPNPGIYIGKPVDYWDFKSNGALSLFENGNAYTSTYQVMPNSKLIVTDLLVFGVGNILSLTPTSTTLYWAQTSPNGGRLTKTVYLKK
jgi:hypothetical protein